MSLPNSELEVSNNEKNPSMSSVAEMADLRYWETFERNSESLVGSLRRRLEARSMTDEWQRRRACS